MMRHSLRPEVRSALFGVMALTLGLLSPAAVDAARPLSIRTGSSLPSGTVGTPYSQALSAAGGTAPYTWTVTAGAVPAGLTLSSAGVLSGTPTASGTANFTVS